MDRSRKRSVAAMLVASIVLGVFTLAPVSAHFTSNTRHLGKHVWREVVKKKVFTKAQSDARY